MKKIIKFTALMIAVVLIALSFAACAVPAEEPEEAAADLKKYTVTFTADEIPAFAADAVLKGAMMYDEAGNEIGLVTDVLTEASVSYASKDGKLVVADKIGYKSLIISATVEAEEVTEGWYVGDALYGIGHNAVYHIGKAEAELTVRSFEEIN